MSNGAKSGRCGDLDAAVDETLVCDNGGELWAVNPVGDMLTLARLPGPCSIVSADDEGVHIVCGREIWRI